MDAGSRGKSTACSARLRAAALAVAWLALPGVVAAQNPAPGAGAVPGSGPGSDRPPSVSLDRLFELPSGFETKPREHRAGGGETEWRARFFEANESLERSTIELQRSKAELADLAEESNAWTLAAPIGGATSAANDAPLSYELRQRIKRQEAAVAAAKRALVDLEIEANLANVPDDWRR